MRRGRSFAAGMCLALTGVALLPAWGNARVQLTDKNAIVACMMEKSTPEDKTVMRAFIISAMQEDDTAMQKNLDLLGDLLVNLAVTKCAMSQTLMNEKDFGEVGEMYGEQLGEALMSAAFDRLN